MLFLRGNGFMKFDLMELETSLYRKVEKYLDILNHLGVAHNFTSGMDKQRNRWPLASIAQSNVIRLTNMYSLQ